MDLTNSQKAVQAIHAAIEATKYIDTSKEHPHLVLIGVNDENSLKDISKYISINDIEFSEWREPDRNNELTSIATEPISGDRRKIFKKFKLLNI